MSVLFDPKVIADQARDELLATDGWLAQTSIVSADPGDIETAISSALQQLAVGVIITPVSFRSTKPNLPGPYFDKVKLRAIVTENNTLNRNGTEGVNYITAQNLCVLVAAALHWFAPAGINERFIVSDILPVSFPMPDSDDQPSLNMWYVEGTAGGGLGYNKGKVAPVQFTYSAANNTVTLSCATQGAAIWYVIGANQGYPSPANPNAKLALLFDSGVLLNEDGQPLYEEDGVTLQMNEAGPTYASIPLFPGQTIFARAWMSGLNPQPAPNDQQSFTAP